MSESHPQQHRSLVLRRDLPLIGVPLEDGEAELVRYSTDDQAAGEPIMSDGIQHALSLAGAWSDLDWDDRT